MTVFVTEEKKNGIHAGFTQGFPPYYFTPPFPTTFVSLSEHFQSIEVMHEGTYTFLAKVLSEILSESLSTHFLSICMRDSNSCWLVL